MRPRPGVPNFDRLVVPARRQHLIVGAVRHLQGCNTTTISADRQHKLQIHSTAWSNSPFASTSLLELYATCRGATFDVEIQHPTIKSPNEAFVGNSEFPPN